MDMMPSLNLLITGQHSPAYQQKWSHYLDLDNDRGFLEVSKTSDLLLRQLHAVRLLYKQHFYRQPISTKMSKYESKTNIQYSCVKNSCIKMCNIYFKYCNNYNKDKLINIILNTTNYKIKCHELTGIQVPIHWL